MPTTRASWTDRLRRSPLASVPSSNPLVRFCCVQLVGLHPVRVAVLPKGGGGPGRRPDRSSASQKKPGSRAPTGAPSPSRGRYRPPSAPAAEGFCEHGRSLGGELSTTCVDAGLCLPWLDSRLSVQTATAHYPHGATPGIRSTAVATVTIAEIGAFAELDRAVPPSRCGVNWSKLAGARHPRRWRLRAFAVLLVNAWRAAVCCGSHVMGWGEKDAVLVLRVGSNVGQAGAGTLDSSSFFGLVEVSSKAKEPRSWT